MSLTRKITNNLDGSVITGNGGVGVSDNEIIQYFNEAQERIQSLADAEFSDYFTTQGLITTVVGQSAYDLPTDIYSYNRVSLVEFRKGATDDYFPVPLINRELTSFENSGGGSSYGAPTGYSIRGNKLVITPTPQSSSGTLRVTYPQKLKRLDIRRGQVTSTTDNGTDYLTILLDDDSNLDNTELGIQDVLNVVDRNGVVNYANIIYTNYNPSTRVLTLDSGYTLADGTITPGDYITLDDNTTTHSFLPDSTERYLLAYASWKLEIRNSSVDSSPRQTELVAMEEELREAFRQQTHDVRRIPRISSVWT